MTIKEALISELDEIDISDDSINKALAKQSLVGTDTYINSLHEKGVDFAYAAILTKVLSRPSVTEGGYSIRWSAEALKIAISGIYSKWNVVNPDALIVKDVSYLW